MKCDKCGHENKKGITAFVNRHIVFIFALTVFAIVMGSFILGAWIL